MVRAGETDTVTTRIFDVALGYQWPYRFEERVLRNEFFDQWSGREEALVSDAAARTALAAAITAEDFDVAHIDAGQGVGLTTAVRPAADVIAQMCDGAAQLLRSWAHLGESLAPEESATLPKRTRLTGM
jgi:nitronate monooxygenase